MENMENKMNIPPKIDKNLEAEELLSQAETYYKEGNFFYAERFYLRALKEATGKSLEITSVCFKQLFNLYVKSESYSAASRYLESYVKIAELQSKPYDISFIKALFEKICIGEIFKIDKVDYYFDTPITDKALRYLLLQINRACVKENYLKAIELLDTKIKDFTIKYPEIDLTIIRNLLIELYRINTVKTRSLNNYYFEVLREAIANDNQEEVESTVEIILKNPFIEKNVVYNMFYTLIRSNYYELVTKKLQELDMTEHNLEIIGALRNAINNQRKFINLPEEDKNNMAESIELGKQYFEEGDLDRAIESYSYGHKKTKGGIFNYYLGKIYFHSGKYEEAAKHFHQYIKSGSDKLSKTYRYLSLIAEKKNDSELSQKYADKSKQLIILYDRYTCLDNITEKGIKLKNTKKEDAV